MATATVATSTSTAQQWTSADMPDQTGRTAVVTGGNSGLGFLTCRELARHGARVILTARDPAKGQRAVDAINAERIAGRVELRQLDLADLDDVRRFAAGLDAEVPRIDMLVNNAGIMMPPRTLTAQGHELQFGVNHLAHFLLTALLWPRLRATESESRVVTISSDLHRRGAIHFDDLNGTQRYGRVAFYAQSKFANTLFALELARRLGERGVAAKDVTIKSVLAHPGYAATNLQMSGPSGVLKLFMHIGNRFMAQPAAMGVLPQLFAATATGVGNGEFIGPDGANEKSGYPTRVQPCAAARDVPLAKRLWQLSAELTSVDPDFAAL